MTTTDTNGPAPEDLEPAPSTSTKAVGRNWRPKFRWFAAEIAVVVVGVLIALALNAWWQARQAASGEESYLALISRDLGQMMDELEELRAFEENHARGGFDAYKAISRGDRSPEQMEFVSEVMMRLTLRRTMRITNPAYKDLLSTGNLQLIRNRELRDQIVAFYEKAEREFEIHNANNASYVDNMFKDQIMGAGLFVFRGATRSTMQTTSDADSIFSSEMAGGYAEDPDPIWSFPNSSPEWAMAKGQLLARVRISVYGELRAERLLSETREIKAAVEAELNR